MFKKKGIAVALVIIVVFVLSGCTPEPVTTTVTKTNVVTTSQTVTVTNNVTQTTSVTETVTETTTVTPSTATTPVTTTSSTATTTESSATIITQPDEIFSEDGKAKTLRHWMEPHITSISVFAVVKNVSDAPITVLYTVDFLDGYGEIIGTMEKYAEDLQPGKSKQLELVYEGNFSQSVMQYFIYLSTE